MQRLIIGGVKKTIALLAFVSSLQASTLMEFSFDELDPLAPPVDGLWLLDLSGNNHSGFYGGGPAVNFGIIEGNDTPSGTNAVSTNETTELILRDNLTDRFDQPAEDSPTPSPYPFIGAADSWTIESILRIPSTFAGVGGIIGHDGAAPEWWLRVTADGNLQYLFADGTATTGAPSTNGLNLKDDAWHHVALVFERTNLALGDVTISLYLDYVQVDSQNFTGFLSDFGDGTKDYNIAGFVNGSVARRLTADIDHFRISDTALLPTDFLPFRSPPPSSKPITIRDIEVSSSTITLTAANLTPESDYHFEASHLNLNSFAAVLNSTFTAASAQEIRSLSIDSTTSPVQFFRIVKGPGPSSPDRP